MMTPERWSLIQEKLEVAAALDSGQRAAFLQELGTTDPNLREELESLLAQDSNSGNLLKTSVILPLEPASLERDPMIGRRLGPYQVVDLLGVGGVVGVVGRVKQDSLDSNPRIAFYVAHTQFPSRATTVALRSRTDPPAMLASTKSELRNLDPDLKLIPRTTRDLKRHVAPHLLAVHHHVPNLVPVPSFIVNRNLVAVRSRNPHLTRPYLQLQPPARSKFRLEPVLPFLDNHAALFRQGNRTRQQQENRKSLQLEHRHTSVLDI